MKSERRELYITESEFKEVNSKENSSSYVNSKYQNGDVDSFGDRFIPVRGSSAFNDSFFFNKQDDCKENHIDKYLLQERECNRLLSFNIKKKKKAELLAHELDTFGPNGVGVKGNEKPKRSLPKRADKVLDAPGLINDYYLNLIDWGSNNILGVCLGDGAFIWNPSTQEGRQFYVSDNPVIFPTSINWATSSESVIALGFSNSKVEIRDLEKNIVLKELEDHWARVSVIQWNPVHENIFATGGKDCEIIHYDTRAERNTLINRGHTHEVCGLKWSPDGSLLASGGNDNALMIWDPRKGEKPLLTFKEHTAAVKALAWCPWQKNLIVSGGGSTDKTIKSWRVDEGKLVHSHKATSQVCSLLWNPQEKELLSAHGYSQFQLSLWEYPSMKKHGDLFGHKGRVLHMSLSPDQRTVVSAGADETLRFWKIFDVNKDSDNYIHKSMLTPLNIR